MQGIKKEFTGGWNGDDHKSRLKKDEYLEAENMQLMTSDGGNGGVLKPLEGNTEIPHVFTGDGFRVGSVVDRSQKRAFYFLEMTEEDDKIVEYNAETDTTTTVMAWSGFGFSKRHLITGATVIGDFLFWTDNNKQPYYINVERAKSGEYPAVLKEEHITLIKRPPHIPLEGKRILRETFNNSFNEDGFRFTYRYVFADNEKSVICIPSKLFIPNFENQKTTGIRVSIPITEAIEETVTEIEFIAINDTTGAAVIFKTLTRDDDGAKFDAHPTTPIKAYFNGSMSGIGVPAEDVVKIAEYIPYKSKALESARDRVFLGQNDHRLPTKAPENILMKGEVVAKTIEQLPIMMVVVEVVVQQTNGTKLRTGGFFIQTLDITQEDKVVGYHDFMFKLKNYDPETPLDKEIIFTPANVEWNFMDSVPLFYQHTQTDAWLTTELGLDPGVTVDWEFERVQSDYVSTNLLLIPKYASLINNYNQFLSAEGHIDLSLNSRISVGVVFYDNFNRNYGVSVARINEEDVDVVNEEANLTGRYGFDYSFAPQVHFMSGSFGIPDWKEIPTWATHYQIVTTKDKNKTSFVSSDVLEFSPLPSISGFDGPDTATSSRQGYELLLSNGDTIGGTQNGSGARLIDDYIRRHINAMAESKQDVLSRLPIRIKYRNPGTEVFGRNPGNNEEFYLPVYDGFRVTYKASNHILYYPDDNHVVRSFYDPLYDPDTDNFFTFNNSMNYRVAFVNKKVFSDNYDMAVNASKLIEADTGYEFKPGDMITINFWDTDDTIKHTRTYPIKSQDGADLLLEGVTYEEIEEMVNPNVDAAGPITNTVDPNSQLDGMRDLLMRMSFTVYSPNTLLDGNIYYDTGIVFPVLNPGTFQRAYYTKSNIRLAGDSYIKNRYVRHPNPNTRYNQAKWITDHGRVSVPVDTDNFKFNLENTVQFSDAFQLGTNINGLNNFSALNEAQTPIEFGAVMKLITAGKTQSEGTVMLAIGENGACSLYIGETFIVDTEGSQFISQSSDVIGSIRPFKVQHGTTNPESVVQIDGRVFWFDLNNAVIARYATNGVFAVTDNKFSQYMIDKLEAIRVWVRDQSFGGLFDVQIHAYGGYNIETKEYLLTFAGYGLEAAEPVDFEPNFFDEENGWSGVSSGG